MQNLRNSINDFNEAKQVIVGGVNSPVRAFLSVEGTPRFIKEGRGAYIIDEDNNSYIDFVQSYGPMILGHGNEVVKSVLHDQIEKGLSFGAPTELETNLAREIIKECSVDKIRLVSSGTEATMSALRLAREYTKKEDIIKFEGCYHGHSDGLLVKGGSGLATFGETSSGGVIKDIAKHTLVAQYNNIQSVKKCIEISKNVAAVIIEPIAGNMGLVPSTIEFLQELREICTKENIVLIFDEVMSGFRASINGSYSFYKIKADLYTFGKVIGGGLPLACFGGIDEIMSYLSPVGNVYQAGTLSGNPLATSAGLATLCEIKKDKNLYKDLELLATYFCEKFEDIATEYGIPLKTCVRGSMFGFFFNENTVTNWDIAKNSDTKMYTLFHQQMLSKGVYFAPSQFETSFICKPFTKDLIDIVLTKIIESFKEIKALI